MLWPGNGVQAPVGIVMRRRRRREPWLMVVAGLSATILLLGAYSPPTVVVDTAFPSQAAEAEFLATIELFRGSPLLVDADLTRKAREWAQAMSGSGLGHSQLHPMLSRWDFVGENVGTGGSVKEIFAALVGSAPHRANLEDSRFSHIGVGVFIDEDGILWTAHVFAGKERDSYRTPASGP